MKTKIKQELNQRSSARMISKNLLVKSILGLCMVPHSSKADLIYTIQSIISHLTLVVNNLLRINKKVKKLEEEIKLQSSLRTALIIIESIQTVLMDKIV